MNGSGSKIGLACAVGALEGAFYEIGVLCALERAIAGMDLTRLDIYVGVSAGAIMASCLANGIPPRWIRKAVLQQQTEQDLNLGPDVLFRPALREYGRRALEIPGAALRALAHWVTRPQDISLFGALMELGRGLPVGLFDGAPFERYLAHVFTTHGRTNAFAELPGVLRVLAVNLDTSEATLFGGPGTGHVPISKAVQASAALPPLFAPVEIDGSYYIDGVARRTLHASAALEEGADLLFCINPIAPVDLHAAGAEGECVHPHLAELGLPAVFSQMFRTMIHSRMRTGFRNYEYEYPGADVILLEPEPSDHSLFFSNVFSFANRYQVIQHACEATRRYLLQHAGRLQPVLARHGLSLRWSELTEAAAPFLAPPPGTVSPGLTTAEVLDGTRAAVERLERVLRRLAENLSEPAGWSSGNGGGGA